METEQQRLAAQVMSRPALVVTYGDTGIGKTVDKLYSFPRGIHVAGWGALKPALSVVGYVPPATIEVKPDELMLARLRDEVVKARAKFKDANAVVIDDLSVVISRSARALEAKHKDGRKLYGVLGTAFGAAVDEWASMGLHTIVDCHERPPVYQETDDNPAHPRGTMLDKGGPGLPGAIGPALVKVSTMALHAVVDTFRRPWPLAYRAGLADGHHIWRSKDRDNIVRGNGPANLAEIMREIGRRYASQYGITVPATWKMVRPPGWEWHEEYVEWAAQAIAQGHPEAVALSHVAKPILADPDKPGHGPFGLRWVVRDVQARVELRKADQLSDIRALGISV